MMSTQFCSIGQNFINLYRRGLYATSRNVLFTSKNWMRVTPSSLRLLSLKLKQPYLVFAGGVGLGVSFTLPIANASEVLPDKILIQQADILYDSNQFQQLYDLLLPYKESGNAELLWRLARATYSLSTKSDGLVKEALGYAQQSLLLDANNFAVHKWMAILLDAASAMDGSKARIVQAYVVKKHMEKACELNPQDATSWHVLALWHYSISDIPWYQRKAASVLFATPPESSFEESLKLFLHAENIDPNFYSKNLLMIGKCYLKMQDKALAAEYLHKAKNYIENVTNATEDDRESKREAEELLRGL